MVDKMLTATKRQPARCLTEHFFVSLSLCYQHHSLKRENKDSHCNVASQLQVNEATTVDYETMFRGTPFFSFRGINVGQTIFFPNYLYAFSECKQRRQTIFSHPVVIKPFQVRLLIT